MSTTTTTSIDCYVTTPPPNPVTFDGGQATDGSCATVQASYPGDTVTPTPITVTTNAPPPTSTTTTTVGISQPGPGTPGACTPSGYAGCSGNGLNGGAGSCYVACTTTTVPITTSAPATAAPVAHVAVPAAGLAFTGADVGETAVIGLVAIGLGLALWRGSRRGRAI